MSYLIIKYVHVIAAVATISGFLLRGYWMLTDSQQLQSRIAKVAPHVVDTVFLAAGVLMVWQLHLKPLQEPWLLAKFSGLAAYILLGTIAVKRGPTKKARTIAFVAAIAVFAYIVGVALARSPLSWLSI